MGEDWEVVWEELASWCLYLPLSGFISNWPPILCQLLAPPPLGCGLRDGVQLPLLFVFEVCRFFSSACHCVHLSLPAVAKLATVDEHHSAMAMGSNTRNMDLQPVSTSHSLLVGDDMGGVSFRLIHTIHYDAKIFVWVFL